MQEWTRHGLLLAPTSTMGDCSHCMVPTPYRISDDTFIVYYSSRNEHNVSSIFYSILKLSKHRAYVVRRSSGPILTPGRLGCFDDSGVTPSSIVQRGNEYYLYYIGWNPGSTIRVNLFGGLAKSKSLLGPFHRYSEAPILERTAEDPLLNTAPFVRQEQLSRMYYISGTSWDDRDKSRYHIKEASSSDGVVWLRNKEPLITYQDTGETNFARPYVFTSMSGETRMWYSVRGANYRIESALSVNGVWVREGVRNGLEPLDDGDLEDQMVEYAAIVEQGGVQFMFYNGNDFGRKGILYATRECR